ncbi:MAG: hypothetical protein IJD92_03475 [Bacilli bacterium]|nr:hypothetical protein [Bacilli bacterium]
MRENNKGSLIILTVIGIATLLIAVIGATFAYFTVTIKYVTTPTKTVVQSTTMLIQFNTLNEMKYEGAMPGRPSEEDNKDNKLMFSLTSAPNMTTETKYNVYLVIDSNNFVGDNLVYLMKQTRDISDTATTIGTTGAAGSEYIDPDSKTEDVVDGVKREIGTIKSSLKAGDKKLIATGELGSHGTVDTWEFELWLKETGEEQNEDQGRVLEAHIEVEPIDLLPETFEPEKVNP